MSTPLFNFSPRLPWSGDVIQDIDPQTQWFFGAIAPEAGSARLERHIALDVVSYGKQLSVLMDAMAELIDHGKVSEPTREKFRARHARIESAKEAAQRNHLAEARECLARLAASDADAYAALLDELRANETPAHGSSARRASKRG
jgi:ribosomal protein L17